MDMLDVSLIFSTLSIGLVAGFVLTYAIVVMPGLSQLDDREFLKAFQVTDGVIQNNQPAFIVIWLGSVVSVAGAILCSITSVGLREALLIVVVGTAYLIGVQGITISVHLPLNNHVQRMNISGMSDQAVSDERRKFEARWNVFNNIRTGIALSVCVSLLIILAVR